jgi:hypothetical protein
MGALQDHARDLFMTLVAVFGTMAAAMLLMSLVAALSRLDGVENLAVLLP